ncbi:MAG: lytic transglycosylase domain-containing protein [Gammaproteobacteria bacterium]|nr:lytic transglycosylase domain-containing protein [Gammaproteobacteria bacterium]
MIPAGMIWILILAVFWAQLGAAGENDSLESAWRMYLTRPARLADNHDFPFGHCFKESAMVHDLPESLLLAVARGESNFDPRARSHANAYGLMQILWPGTARHLGIHTLTALQDPCTNVDGGARYLRELLNRYQGNLHRALAAYNYGPGRVPVSAGRVPDGAVWYSGYIRRHLARVLETAAGGSNEKTGGRWLLIRFQRPYRAAAFMASIQSQLGEIRLDGFNRPGGGFDVLMLYDTAQELANGKRKLSDIGIGGW